MKSIFLALLAVLFISSGAQAATPPADQGPVGCPYISNPSCSIPVYPAGAPYVQYQFVSASDGNIYQAQQATSTDPVASNECGTNWKPYSVTVSGSTAVPAKCATIQAAVTFSFKYIAAMSPGATWAINVSDGTQTPTGPINLDSPFGRQFSIIGDAASPASNIINYAGFQTTAATPRGLFELTNGHGFRLINGFAYTGPTNSVCTPNCQTASSGYTGAGFLSAVGSGAYVTLGPNVTMAGGYFCANAAQGAVIVADATTCSGAGDGGYWAYGPGSLVTTIGACGINAATPTIFAGAILLADNRGTIWADNGHFGGGASGAALFNDGDIRVGGAFFGRDCSNNSLSNSTADVYFHYSSYLNMEGGATYASGTPRRHSYINWIDGAAFDDTSGGVLGADISNYLESAHIWENNSILGRVAINKSGFGPFSNYPSLTTQGFYMSSDSNIPLRFATQSKLAGGVDTSQNFFQVGSTSGTITLHPQAAAGTYNWNWPITAGTSGYFLTSDGGGAGGGQTWTANTFAPLASPTFTGTVTLSTNTVNLTGSTFSASGCTAVTVAATTGALGCTVSDRRLKVDGGVFPDETALSDILAMPDLHTYQFQYGQGPGGHFIGYFAQDVQAVHPGWVMRGSATELTPDGTLQYDQNHPVPELVGAIKALNHKVDEVAAGLPVTTADPLVPLQAKIDSQQLQIVGLFVWSLFLTAGAALRRRRS